MNKKTISLGLGLLMVFASVAPAADRMAVSNDTLASMGLGGMQQMSDEAGMNVRGKGFSLSGGLGWSRFLRNGSVDGNLLFSHPRGGTDAATFGGHLSTSVGGGNISGLGWGIFCTASLGLSGGWARQ